METKPDPKLEDLYPELNEQELAEVEDRLEQYLALVLKIFERKAAESYPQAGPLTPKGGTLPCTRSDSEAANNHHHQ